MTEPIVGCMIIRKEDSSNLYDQAKVGERVTYPVDEWVTAPGNGAYVVIGRGILTPGRNAFLAYLECTEPTGVRVWSRLVFDVDGDYYTKVDIRCFRRVRRLAEPAPERVTSELRRGVTIFCEGRKIMRCPKRRGRGQQCSLCNGIGTVLEEEKLT